VHRWETLEPSAISPERRCSSPCRFCKAGTDSTCPTAAPPATGSSASYIQVGVAGELTAVLVVGPMRELNVVTSVSSVRQMLILTVSIFLHPACIRSIPKSKRFIKSQFQSISNILFCINNVVLFRVLFCICRAARTITALVGGWRCLDLFSNVSTLLHRAEMSSHVSTRSGSFQRGRVYGCHLGRIFHRSRCMHVSTSSQWRASASIRITYVVSGGTEVFGVKMWGTELSMALLSATTPHEFLITGDFNLHMDDPKQAKEFLSVLNSTNLTQHVSFHTHRDNHTLDFVITDNDSSLSLSSITHLSLLPITSLSTLP